MSDKDHIHIRGLRAKTRIGVTEEERSRPQVLLVDIAIELSIADAARSDDVEETVDYDSLVNDVVAEIEGTERRLLERLAADLSDRILERNGVLGVTVEVAKEDPPVQHEVESISVRMERRK